MYYIQDKTGLTAAIVRKRVGLPERGTPVYRNGKDVTPAVAQEEVETLNPEIFTKALNLSEGTSSNISSFTFFFRINIHFLF